MGSEHDLSCSAVGVCPHTEMAQDREHEQSLQVTADSLMTEQQALQKRLQQLTLQYEADVDEVQQLQSGGCGMSFWTGLDVKNRVAMACACHLPCWHLRPLGRPGHAAAAWLCLLVQCDGSPQAADQGPAQYAISHIPL